jgi:hypothetical protein
VFVLASQHYTKHPIKSNIFFILGIELLRGNNFYDQNVSCQNCWAEMIEMKLEVFSNARRYSLEGVSQITTFKKKYLHTRNIKWHQFS